MPLTEVILIENLPGLGAEADVVKVRPGYARNFLIPTGRACEVTPSTLRQLNHLKAKRAEREGRELNEAEELARRINKLKTVMFLETGEGGKAFGSITAKDLSDKLKSELGGQIEIDRHRIELEHPIKQTGALEIPIKLHPDVIAKFNLTVKSKADLEPKADEPADDKRGGKKPARSAK